MTKAHRAWSFLLKLRPITSTFLARPTSIGNATTPRSFQWRTLAADAAYLTTSVQAKCYLHFIFFVMSSECCRRSCSPEYFWIFDFCRRCSLEYFCGHESTLVSRIHLFLIDTFNELSVVMRRFNARPTWVISQIRNAFPQWNFHVEKRAQRLRQCIWYRRGRAPNWAIIIWKKGRRPNWAIGKRDGGPTGR